MHACMFAILYSIAAYRRIAYKAVQGLQTEQRTVATE